MRSTLRLTGQVSMFKYQGCCVLELRNRMP